MTCGIYAIETLSGRKYIGSSVNIGQRWGQHKSHLRSGKHHCIALQRAYNKYGEDALQFKIILECEKEQLLDHEQSWIDRFERDELYNASMIAGRVEMTPEVCAKVSATLMGHPVSPEARAKMGVANKGRKNTPEAIAKTSAANRGRKRSPEVRAKISATLMGHPGAKGPRAKRPWLAAGISRSTWYRQKKVRE